jgi:hypothetical protein
VLGQAHGQPAQREQMQPGDEREGIEVQGWAPLTLGTVIGWRWDWSRAFTGGRNHGLISFGRGRAASGDQPTPCPGLCNTLNEHNGASRKAGLNKSIHDAGWYAFRRILTCKAACAGKRVEAIPPAFTTQDCSGCGERVQKSLSVRTHICTNCGLILDRDENAALNILVAGRAGKHRAGQARQARTWPAGASVA